MKENKTMTIADIIKENEIFSTRVKIKKDSKSR